MAHRLHLFRLNYFYFSVDFHYSFLPLYADVGDRACFARAHFEKAAVEILRPYAVYANEIRTSPSARPVGESVSRVCLEHLRFYFTELVSHLTVEKTDSRSPSLRRWEQ